MKNETQKGIVKYLLLAALFQLSILAGEYVVSLYPYWTGQKVRLATTPYDPRSLFRGNYARLNYEISNMPLSEVDEDAYDEVREGEIIYVKLIEDDGVWIANGATLEKPESGLFIRGRVTHFRSWVEPGPTIDIRYGIEAYFAPKDKAQQLERDMWRNRQRGFQPGGPIARKIALVDIMLAPNGKAGLVSVDTDVL